MSVILTIAKGIYLVDFKKYNAFLTSKTAINPPENKK
jgi:hypothetical protein